MTTDIQNIPLQDNKERHAFEMRIGEYTAFIAYDLYPGAVALTHTEVPEALEGKGVGSALVAKTLQRIESEHKKVIPLCPFVKSYIRRHPEWERIVEA